MCGRFSQTMKSVGSNSNSFDFREVIAEVGRREFGAKCRCKRWGRAPFCQPVFLFSVLLFVCIYVRAQVPLVRALLD